MIFCLCTALRPPNSHVFCLVDCRWISPMRDAGCLRAQPRHLHMISNNISNSNIPATVQLLSSKQIEVPYCRHACSVTGMYLIAFEAQQVQLRSGVRKGTQIVSLNGRICWCRIEQTGVWNVDGHGAEGGWTVDRLPPHCLGFLNPLCFRCLLPFFTFWIFDSPMQVKWQLWRAKLCP